MSNDVRIFTSSTYFHHIILYMWLASN